MRNVGGIGHLLPDGAVSEGRGENVGHYPCVLLSQEAFDSWPRCAGTRSNQKDSPSDIPIANLCRLRGLPPGLHAAFQVRTAHLRRYYDEVRNSHGDLGVVCGSPHQIDDDIVVSGRQFSHKSAYTALAGWN